MKDPLIEFRMPKRAKEDSTDTYSNSLYYYLNREKRYYTFFVRETPIEFSDPSFLYNKELSGPNSPVVPHYEDEYGRFVLLPSSLSKLL